MTNMEFWRYFLFETSFAVLRDSMWSFFPITVILSFCFSIKAKVLYYKQKKFHLI